MTYGGDDDEDYGPPSIFDSSERISKYYASEDMPTSKPVKRISPDDDDVVGNAGHSIGMAPAKNWTDEKLKNSGEIKR